MANEMASPAVRPSSPGAFLATLLATGFGAGYSKIAPGTAGTVVGLVLFWPLHSLPAPYLVAATVVLFFAGVAASTYTAERVRIKDPRIVVVDEIIGMWISLLFLPWNTVTVVLGFFLFRLFDVVKPPPARGFEKFPGGWGIMMDDVMAGIYANLVLQIGLRLWGRL